MSESKANKRRRRAIELLDEIEREAFEALERAEDCSDPEGVEDAMRDIAGVQELMLAARQAGLKR